MNFLLLNFLFNLIFVVIIVYLIIRNNDIVNKIEKDEKSGDFTGTGIVTSLRTGQETTQETKEQIQEPGTTDKKRVSFVKETEGTEGTEGTKETKVTEGTDKKEKKHSYNYEKCIECVNRNRGRSTKDVTNCPECGSENYDTGCIPAILHKGKPTNCIPKSKFTREQAFRACVGVSSATQQCNLIDIDDKTQQDRLSYMSDECGEDSYYCAFDESDSCSYRLCKLDDYYSYGEDSICNCEPSKSAREKMGEGWGRECLRGSNCSDYMPYRKAPELWYDPKLAKFYDGYVTYMDVPNIEKPITALIADSQMV